MLVSFVKRVRLLSSLIAIQVSVPVCTEFVPLDIIVLQKAQVCNLRI